MIVVAVADPETSLGHFYINEMSTKPYKKLTYKNVKKY